MNSTVLFCTSFSTNFVRKKEAQEEEEKWWVITLGYPNGSFTGSSHRARTFSIEFLVTYKKKESQSTANTSNGGLVGTQAGSGSSKEAHNFCSCKQKMMDAVQCMLSSQNWLVQSFCEEGIHTIAWAYVFALFSCRDGQVMLRFMSAYKYPSFEKQLLTELCLPKTTNISRCSSSAPLLKHHSLFGWQMFAVKQNYSIKMFCTTILP